MEAAYSAILATNPTDVRALLGRATARSWQGNRAGARADFNAVLADQPANLEALIGLGYDLAWGGDLGKAADTFQRALTVAPEDISAQKGLAFTRLWAGDPPAALQLFEAVSSQHPGDGEALRGIGQAHLAMDHASRAEDAFQGALSVDAKDMAARDGIRTSRAIPPAVEATVWAGNSADGGDIGLRSAEIASWIRKDTRVAVRYDNSLSLDNPALARAGIKAETWFLSAQHNFEGGPTLIAEIGQRELPDNADQQIYKIEGVQSVGGVALKVGAQLSPHSDGYDDQLAFGGASFGLGERVSLDTTLFLSKYGSAQDEEIRAALFAEYKDPEGWTLGAGVGAGDISSSVPGAAGAVNTAHVIGSVPVAGRHSAFIQWRWEQSPLDDYSTVMVGMTFRLPRS
jgi:tetratricopeptide (TPR) repeat protein